MVVVLLRGERGVMIPGSEPAQGEKIWKMFLRKHWKMLIVFIIAAIAVVAGAVLVLLWFVENAQATGLAPALLGLWTMNHLVMFLLYLLFWEIVIIGIPVLIVILIIVFLWWKKLPTEERTEYRRGHLFGKRSRRSDGSGAVSFFVFLGFIIKVYVDGNWNVAFATWTFNYVVYSLIWVVVWIAVIAGIPLVLGGIWWLRRQMKLSP
jgi:hypothetical protein